MHKKQVDIHSVVKKKIYRNVCVCVKKTETQTEKQKQIKEKRVITRKIK
jgi:hypothetical protein